ncbi:MAG TPA: hypothetical protein VKV37_17330 [Ktedonobacteraceae bacterium]|nr:hypothetical protein [Ktedonobacteraceae bacterium]
MWGRRFARAWFGGGWGWGPAWGFGPRWWGGPRFWRRRRWYGPPRGPWGMGRRRCGGWW